MNYSNDQSSRPDYVERIFKEPVQQPEIRDGLWVLSASKIHELSLGLGNPRAILTRGMLEWMGFREDLPFHWGLEHKLLQYSVLSQAVSGIMPKTLGLGTLATTMSDNALYEYLQVEFANGFVIKPTRTFCSSREAVLSSGDFSNLIEAADRARRDYSGTPASEPLIVQQRIETTTEYRVHSLGRRVIPNLTFRTYGPLPPFSDYEREEVNNAVQCWLATMPDVLVSHTLCGWDVARDLSGRLVVFEVNLSGYHRCYQPGFHCSGVFSNESSGELCTAKLIHFARVNYGLTVDYAIIDANDELTISIAEMLHRVGLWNQVLDLGAQLDRLYRDSFFNNFSKLGSLRQLAYLQKLRPSDFQYLEFVNWLHQMTATLR